MKGLIALPIGALALGCYVYAGTHAVQNYKSVVGDGKLTTQNRKVGTYSKIVIGSAFEGQFFETTPGPLTISADSNLLPYIQTEVKQDTLYVKIKGSVSTKNGFRITGRTARISAVDASGATKLEIKGIGKHPLDLSASGASRLTIFGAPISVQADASGASAISLGSVTLEKLVAELSGASKINVSGTAKNVSIEASGASSFDGKLSGDKFAAEASGASNIRVKGHFNSSSASSSGASSITKPN